MKYLFPNKKIIDISGHKSGYLTVTTYSHIDEQGTAVWNAVCECGSSKKVRAAQIKNRGVKTCGSCKFWKSLLTRRYYE